MRQRTTTYDRPTGGSADAQGRVAVCVVVLALALSALVGCERKPDLHLHYDAQIDIELKFSLLQLDSFWNYVDENGVRYKWQDEWFYGWDDNDVQIFGPQGYTQPDVFNLRRYYTGSVGSGAHLNVISDMVRGMTYSGLYSWGFWDVLAWNNITTSDGVQSLVIDEGDGLSDVLASTGQTMRSARYQAPVYTRSFYQPEELFSSYLQGIEVSRNLDGFVYDEDRGVWVKTINMELEPRAYIYLTQVILRHNRGKVAGVDGMANLSGMSRGVNLNTGVTGNDAVTVSYNVRFKTNRTRLGESVDIAGGRVLTFGMCGVNGTRAGLSTSGSKMTTSVNDGLKHYMEVKMLFNNGYDSTFVFDVTDQVRRRYKGGVLTVVLDMDTISAPTRPGGSGFDAIVKDYEDGGTHSFDM